MAKLSDYDRWFKPCEKCGYDTGKASEKSKPNCWRCGNRIQRDYSDRALKKTNNVQLDINCLVRQEYGMSNCVNRIGTAVSLMGSIERAHNEEISDVNKLLDAANELINKLYESGCLDDEREALVRDYLITDKPAP